jgi:hypothetical protein
LIEFFGMTYSVTRSLSYEAAGIVAVPLHDVKLLCSADPILGD